MEQIKNSAYLQNLLRLTGRRDWSDTPELAKLAIQQINKELEQDEHLDYSDWSSLGEYLADKKRHFSLALAIADIAELMSVDELGKQQSRFAELTLDVAIRAAWQQPAIKSLCRDLPAPGESVPGMFVLGLGKLGGEDLNYSSDIDLIAFFDKSLLPIQPMQGANDVCSRVLKSVTQLFSGKSGSELIWRVDWRLRPEASATQIAMSIEAAMDYYHFRALPWHRLALMKARVVAGDKNLGEEFLRDIDSFIWRQNLDFRAIEEIAQLKERIDLEHPKLTVRGKRETQILEKPQGFNLKLGSGGIREIEFVINGLQLIWGGKRPQLRVCNSLEALSLLAKEELVDTLDAEVLRDDYVWLRRLENRLQMLNNEQTHNIPISDTQFQSFLSINSVVDAQAFSEEVVRRRTRVHKIFDLIFRPTEEVDDAADLPNLDKLSDRTRDILQSWEDGFSCYGASGTQATSFRVLYFSLLKEIKTSSAAPDEAIDRLDSFFRQLPPGGQYLSLLQSSPLLLQGLVLPLIYSPPMRLLLQQSPHIIDGLLVTEDSDERSDNPVDSQSGNASWILQSRDYDVRLERIRRQVNEDLYKLYLRFLQQQLEPLEFQAELSMLALFALNTAMKIVDEQTSESPQICIFGLGKLGMSRMAPMSDLDIIYIFSDEMPLEKATAYVNRLQTVLATKMREGVVYPMDTRLRPSGQSGAPTISLTSFSGYQLERAKTWEHIALVAGRSVAGHNTTGDLVSAVRRQALCKPRDRKQFVKDAGKMLQRIRQQRIAEVDPDVINTKLRPGGLMETEYLIACLCIRFAPEHPDLLEQSYLKMVDKLADLAQLPELSANLQFWSNLQIWERLLGLENCRIEDIPLLFREAICSQLGLHEVQQIIEKSSTISAQILNLIDQELLLAEISAEQFDAWPEEPVRWQE